MKYFLCYVVYSNDTCTATVKYDCSVKLNAILWWEVYNGEKRQLFSPSFQEFDSIGTNHRLNTVPDIMIYAELSDINTANIYSILIITYNVSFFGLSVICSDIIREPYERGK